MGAVSVMGRPDAGRIREAPRHNARDGALDQSSFSRDNWPLFALMSYRYASLYVVVEGYEELGFSHSGVDALLADATKKDLLRRYRNGAFHFQARFIDDRFVKLLEDAEHFRWVRSLHQEFIRFFREELADIKATPEQRRKIDEAVVTIVGWAGWLHTGGG